MIDNFAQISELMKFDNQNDYYFIEIISRKKDNGERDRIIRTYTVSSVESLMNIYDEVIKMCDVFNARAYIYINRRNFRNTTIKMICELTRLLYGDMFKKSKRMFDSCSGSTPCTEKGGKMWIIDIDTPQSEGYSRKDALLLVTSALPSELSENYVTTINTKNGAHMIVKPFNPNLVVSAFRKIVDDGIAKEIDIKKDAMTLLYCK